MSSEASAAAPHELTDGDGSGATQTGAGQTSGEADSEALRSKALKASVTKALTKALRRAQAQEEAQGEARVNPLVYEDPLRTACVRCVGQAAFVFVGLVLFAAVLSGISVSGLTDMPRYADNLLYASLAHHFEDVHARLFEASPPPPPAF